MRSTFRRTGAIILLAASAMAGCGKGFEEGLSADALKVSPKAPVDQSKAMDEYKKARMSGKGVRKSNAPPGLGRPGG
jgi:hypothetical protein